MFGQKLQFFPVTNFWLNVLDRSAWGGVWGYFKMCIFGVFLSLKNMLKNVLKQYTSLAPDFGWLNNIFPIIWGGLIGT